jgi:hypothetical protein
MTSETKKSAGKTAKLAKSAKKASAEPTPLGPVGTHAGLAGPIVADAAIEPGFSFTPELDRLFAAGYPHLAVLHPTPVPEEKHGAAFVDVFGKEPYHVEWPANLARPLVRLLPLGGVGALEPGTTTLTERGREIFADRSDVGDDEAEALFRAALGKRFYPRVLRNALWLHEAVVGERALLAFARALDGLTRDQLHGKPELAQLFAFVPTMLLRTSPAVHDEVLGLLRALFARHADSPHRPVSTEQRAIDVLDVVANGDEGRRRRYPGGIDHGALGLFAAPTAEARAAYAAIAMDGPGTWGPDVRRVYLAGKASLELEMQWIDRYARSMTTAPERMLETFGLVNDPRSIELLVRLHARRPLAKRVEAWMAQHAELARPVLTRLAEGGEHAERAKGLVAKLGG